jgi:hypothetical protein
MFYMKMKPISNKMRRLDKMIYVLAKTGGNISNAAGSKQEIFYIMDGITLITC